MIKRNETYAYFTITDSFDPSDITQRVGVKPSDAWRKGDLHPKNQMERKFSRWSLKSRLKKTAKLEEHIRDVLKQLEITPAIFQAISKEYGGVMQLVGYFHVDYPGLHFENDIVNGLARFGLSVDFDFYFLYSNGREDT